MPKTNLTETQYLDIANLARVRACRAMLADMLWTGKGSRIKNSRVIRADEALGKLENQLFDTIDQIEFQPAPEGN